MTAIRAHWQQGRVVLDQPATWAEGSPLVICDADEVESNGDGDELIFMTEESQLSETEAIARRLAKFDAMPVLEMTAEDEAAMWAWQKRMGDYTVEAMRQEWLRNEEP